MNNDELGSLRSPVQRNQATRNARARRRGAVSVAKNTSREAPNIALFIIHYSLFIGFATRSPFHANAGGHMYGGVMSLCHRVSAQ